MRYYWIKFSIYQILRQQMVLAYYAPYLRTRRRSGRVYRIFWLLEITIILLLKQKRWLLPLFQVSRIWAALAPGSVSYGQDFDWCSSISATWTAAGTGSCLLEKYNFILVYSFRRAHIKMRTLKQSFARKWTVCGNDVALMFARRKRIINFKGKAKKNK